MKKPYKTRKFQEHTTLPIQKPGLGKEWHCKHKKNIEKL